MRGVLLASGPSLDLFDFGQIQKDDFVMAVNFAGAGRGVHGLAVVDTWAPARFMEVYPRKDLPVFCVEDGPALDGFTSITTFPGCPIRIRTSAAGLGLYALHHLGCTEIIGVGLDTQFSDKYENAKSLVDAGFYPKGATGMVPQLKDAVKYAVFDLGLNLKIFNPSEVKQ